MFHITIKGNLKNEQQLIESSELPENAVQFKEGNEITDVLKIGGLIGLPILLVMLVVGIDRLSSINCKITLNLQFACIVIATLILFKVFIYIHEIIHCIFYPTGAKKYIWKDVKSGAYLAYCDAEVSKMRFIIISLAPVVLIGLFSYILWYIFAPVLMNEIALCWLLFSWISVASSVGDFTNVYHTLKQVPKGARVRNYGYHSYWIPVE